jgi:hypothetical protein
MGLLNKKRVQGARHKVQGLIQLAGCSGQQAARLIEKILCN